MLAQEAMEVVAELQTILSLKPATFLSASSLPELDIFGQRTRLLLIDGYSKTIRFHSRLATRAASIAKLLGDRGVVPVLVTAETGSQLTAALRDAGWGILVAPSNGPIDRALQPVGNDVTVPPVPPWGARHLSLFCALWQGRKRPITATGLASMAEVSPPVARRFLSQAVADGWVGRSKTGREYQYRVDDSRALVDRFHAMAKIESQQWQCFSVRPDIFAQLPQRLVEFSRLRRLEYAATGRYVASFYLSRQQATSELRLRIAPSTHLSDLLTHLRAAQAAEANANLKIMIAMETASWLFRGNADGLNIANPLIVAADLTRSGDPMAADMTAWLFE